jgi:hypothetical protein
MPLTDDELFDFDRSRLARWDKEQSDQALKAMPDLYRNHLTIAKWIDYWREGLEKWSQSPTNIRDDEYYKGMFQALRDIAAHLRQTDFLPGSILFDNLTERSS